MIAPMRKTALAALLLAGCVASPSRPPAAGTKNTEKPWLGVMGLSPVEDVPRIGLKRFPVGLRVLKVLAGSPAEAGGMRSGDVIVEADGVDFAAEPAALPNLLRSAVAARQVGDLLKLTVVRDRVEAEHLLDGVRIEPRGRTAEEILDKARPGSRYRGEAERRLELRPLEVRLAPARAAKRLPADDAIFPEPPEETPESARARALAREAGLEDRERDLLERLSKTHETPDAWRLERMAYAHRNPWRLAGASQRLLRETAGAASSPARISAAAAWIGLPLPQEAPCRPSPETLSLEQRLAEIQTLLARIRARWDAAFERVSADDRTHLEEALANQKDWVDFEPGPRMLAICERVDRAALCAAAALAAGFVEGMPGPFLRDLEAGLAAGGSDRVERDTPFGRIVVSGKGNDWHQGEPPAFLVDLGGDDLYTSGAGASDGRKRPVGIAVDCAGDDAYQASTPWSQGCGKLGIGLLADLAGDDRYLGQDWTQGAAFLGCGVLLDGAGDDTFRAGDCVQGCALWGVALASGGPGDDRYEASGFAQACAMTGGFALLLDEGGDDRYFAKGRHATGYGDPGLFDAMSQGCGLGLREASASGGIACLADLTGDDRYEAGHFSQGGGYYYGWGLLFDREGNDGYLGSRYAQGFAAHQALGYFEDAAGDDRYATLQGVAQGCSWDETAVVFLDRAGDDVYEGGSGFSQGAVAHNGFCLFADLGGDDAYRAKHGQAISRENDYHGGHSLTVFLDGGGGSDRYAGSETPVAQDAVNRPSPEGVLADLKEPLSGTR